MQGFATMLRNGYKLLSCGIHNKHKIVCHSECCPEASSLGEGSHVKNLCVMCTAESETEDKGSKLLWPVLRKKSRPQVLNIIHLHVRDCSRLRC